MAISVEKANTNGYYWSSTLEDESTQGRVSTFFFNSGACDSGEHYSFKGGTVCLVSDKEN